MLPIINLVANGSFETGDLSGWSAVNTTVSRTHAHTGTFSAQFPYGAAQATLAQTIPINAGENNFQLHLSLAKLGFQNSHRIFINLSYLDDNNNVVGQGLNVEIPYGSISGARLGGWREVLQITESAPANATHIRLVISKPLS